IFRKYKIINKTGIIGFPETFNEMYISMWSDSDIGYSLDDFAGSDTLLNMVYTYNAYELDEVYEPHPPPAVGFTLLKGPTIAGNNILAMTASYYYGRITVDPWWWTYAELLYLLMQGRDGFSGEFFTNPATGLSTTFALSGNPINGEGWVDGLLEEPGLRRIGLGSGPIQMAPGDTQEVVIAEIAALGADRLHSVKLLRFYTAMVRDAFNSGLEFVVPPKPPTPEVSLDDADRVTILNWGGEFFINRLNRKLQLRRIQVPGL
ncbi:hypothetical protein ACFLSS_04455, partial [Bacteroidota bacterium]